MSPTIRKEPNILEESMFVVYICKIYKRAQTSSETYGIKNTQSFSVSLAYVLLGRVWKRV